MTTALQKAPRILRDEAQQIAKQLYYLKVSTSPLPSERDQNFLLQTERGERFVLKIANAGEEHDFLNLQNQLIRFLSAGSVNLEFPRIVSSTAAREAAWLVEEMKNRGVLLSTDGPFHNVIKIKPPIIFSQRDADVLVSNLNAVLKQDFH